MSTVKIKQLNAPAPSNSGATVVFDGDYPKWSSDTQTGILLPGGPSSTRPEMPLNGLMRLNSETNQLEVFHNDSWTFFNTGTLAFGRLADVPQSFNGGGNMVVKVKPDETGLEFAPIPSGLMKYRFRVDFSGTNPNAVSVSGETTNWDVSIQNTDDLLIVHNLNQTPLMAVAYGRDPVTTTKYYAKMAGTGTTGVFTVSYDSGNMNQCYLENLTTFNVNAAADTHCYIDMYFLVAVIV